MLWSAILVLAARQHGLVTRSQVLAAGGSDAWLLWSVSDGRLWRVRHGVYAVVGSESVHQPLMAACLAAGPVAAASHLAAASLWGARQVKVGQLEITNFGNRLNRLPGVTVHRSRLGPAAATTLHLNIPVVVAPLAVVQLAETCHPHLVKSVASDLVKQNWTTFRSILDWIDVVGDRRRQALREMCARAIDLGGHSNSPAARILGERLKAAGAPPFEMDYPVETPDGLVLIDFAWPRPKVGLEYNGAADHDSLLAKADDARRRSRLAALGWRMLEANSATRYEEIVRWALAALTAPAPAAVDPQTTL